MTEDKPMPWSNPRYVSWTPIITTVLLEAANVQQICRMWGEKTAAGQSLTGWMCVNMALVLWYNFYRVVTPNEWIAKIGTGLGIFLNSMVILSIVYFRYVVGRG